MYNLLVKDNKNTLILGIINIAFKPKLQVTKNISDLKYAI